ncbi:hypothetical protein [Epibacterium ulvae]|uniref:hypothetical protein n=1 Tax=Epibacterium ulvae TaxID=1156985 RepID=UPI00249346DE|nr:hypothetical protein [Epibacterium ulvae]
MPQKKKMNAGDDMKKFNTHLKNRHFQEIHHALGCPWPDEIMGETYRNCFCTGDDTETAALMAASPHWTSGQAANGSIYFNVTQEGRKALKSYILENVYVPARFAVTYRGYENDPILLDAKTRSGARYRAYQHSESDEPFIEFVAQIASIRTHSQAINPHLAT